MGGCLLQESEVALKKADNEGKRGSKQMAFHIAFFCASFPVFSGLYSIVFSDL